MNSESEKTFVKFEKIDKSYDGEVLVVKDLNLDIPQGEFLTLLGPSGSGKTTTAAKVAKYLEKLNCGNNLSIYFEKNFVFVIRLKNISEAGL